MPFLLIAGVALLAIFFAEQSQAKGKVATMGLKKRMYGLDDISPEEQGGSFDRTYDDFFEEFADEYNVPFALLKAHAIQESSLNPNAFTDENPDGHADREGWASRGLMQVLWWPGSDRFAKYGHNDVSIQEDGSGLFDAHINIDIGAQIIRDNLTQVKGNLRDAINMYNTGKKESEFEAPKNYVDRVLKYYNQILGKE